MLNYFDNYVYSRLTEDEKQKRITNFLCIYKINFNFTYLLIILRYSWIELTFLFDWIKLNFLSIIEKYIIVFFKTNFQQSNSHHNGEGNLWKCFSKIGLPDLWFYFLWCIFFDLFFNFPISIFGVYISQNSHQFVVCCGYSSLFGYCRVPVLYYVYVLLFRLYFIYFPILQKFLVFLFNLLGRTYYMSVLTWHRGLIKKCHIAGYLCYGLVVYLFSTEICFIFLYNF